MSSPERRYQFAAAEAVKRAFNGNLTMGDQLSLAKAAMRTQNCAGQKYTTATLKFLDQVDKRPKQAAHRLNKFLKSIRPPDELTDAPDIPETGWQDRKDIGHD
jgi:hypothetical protein